VDVSVPLEVQVGVSAPLVLKKTVVSESLELKVDVSMPPEIQVDVSIPLVLKGMLQYL
jgi:hypothetical protein